LDGSRRGITLARAQADLDRVAATLEADYTDDNANIGVGLTSVRDYLAGDLRPTLWLLLAAVGALLLIAAANVAGLLVARAASRQHEVALRVALGATPLRLVAQFLTESTLLAIVGGTVGVLLASALTDSLAALSPADLRPGGAVHVNGQVLLFSLAISLATGLAFGLAPSRQLLRLSLHDDLKQSGRVGGNGAPRRLRTILVATEIALSLVLLVTAGLTITSLIKLQRESPGFDPNGVLTVEVALANAKYPTPETKRAFWNQTVSALQRIPGLRAVAASNRLPMVHGNSRRGLTIPGLAPDLIADAGANYRVVTPEYFRTMGIPLVGGRSFTEADRDGGAPVAIVSASMAARYWPNGDALGRSFAISATNVQMTIVGIVGDVHHSSLEDQLWPSFYVPLQQNPWAAMTLAIRTDTPPTAIAGVVRDAIWSVDKDQAIGPMLTMDERLSGTMARRRFSVTLFTCFGVAAAALAAVGLYGVLAFIVAQRGREIGVRLALGATRWSVLSEVIGQGVRLAAIGIAAGLALALGATRLLRALLYGTTPSDAPTLVIVSVLLVGLAALASVVPAVRASRVDPLIALRED
jgi:putative ABC transport system permease protein